MIMDEDINKTESIDVTQQPSKMAAANAVFGTYELLETIIKSLRPEDIPSMSLVNKTSYDITRTNNVLKRLLSSAYFCTKVGEATRWAPGSQPRAVTHYATGIKICVLRLRDKEVIVVFRHRKTWADLAGGAAIPVPVSPEPKGPAPEPVLFTSDQEIPGLTDRDRVWLSEGWIEQLRRRTGGVNGVGFRNGVERAHDREFMKRLVDGVHKLVGPASLLDGEDG